MKVVRSVMINHDDTRDCFHRCIMTRSICSTRWKGEISRTKSSLWFLRTPGQSPPTREEHMNSYLAIRVGCPTFDPFKTTTQQVFFHCFVNYVTCNTAILEWNGIGLLWNVNGFGISCVWWWPYLRMARCRGSWRNVYWSKQCNSFDIQFNHQWFWEKHRNFMQFSPFDSKQVTVRVAGWISPRKI